MPLTDHEFDTMLRAAGNVLDERSAAHVVVRPAREQRSRRHLAGFAAAGLVAASVAAFVVVVNVRDGTDRSSDRATVPTTPSTDTATDAGPTTAPAVDLDPATFPGVQVCADALAEYRVPARPLEFATPDAASAEILLLDIPDEPTRVRVVMIGNGAVYSCTVERDINADGRIISGALTLVSDRDPTADGVVLDDLQITGGVDSGPGAFIAIGRVGAQVVSVSVDLPDGTSYAGVVTSGGFVINGRIPTGVPLVEQRVSWTLTSGERRSSRADLLDEPSESRPI
jgi:hypothetical protein